jgi:putative transposase
MTKHSPFRYFKTSPEIIRLAVMLYVRFSVASRYQTALIDLNHNLVSTQKPRSAGVIIE